MEDNKNKIYKSSEVCELLKCSMAGLKNWWKQGKIEAIVINGRRYYTEQAIENFINSHRQVKVQEK